MDVGRLGRVGIWSRQLRYGDRSLALECAAELEELGFGALWIPGGVGGDLLESVRAVLGATRKVVVATGILNVWAHPAEEVAEEHVALDRDYPGRFLLGLGVSHAPLIDADEAGRYREPLTVMTRYLDELDRLAPVGAARSRVLAALAPKMLALAAARSLGTHPYLVPVEHTRFARETIGTGVFLAPALSAILTADRSRAEEIARADLALYLGLPNYVNAWRRVGYGEDDFANGGSGRLVHALYALGTPDDVAARVAEHHAAGADHVCIRVVTGRGDEAVHLPAAEWRELAPLVAD